MIFRVNIFANTFRLLDELVAKGDKETDFVYKTLIKGFIPLYKGKTSDLEIDQVSTELIFHGFSEIFAQADSQMIRKSDLLDPLLD